MAVCGRPFHLLKSCFSVLALWCFIFQYAALSFFRSWASPWLALGCPLGRRARSGRVDGSRLSKKAFPCSAALAFLKNHRSHAAWRSFCVFRNARRPLAAGLGGTYAKAFPCSVALISLQKLRSHAAWRSKCSASLRRHLAIKNIEKRLFLNGLERFWGTLFWRPFFCRNAAMQRGARFFWRRGALMQRGARFWIVIFFSRSLGGRLWAQWGRPKYL